MSRSILAPVQISLLKFLCFLMGGVVHSIRSIFSNLRAEILQTGPSDSHAAKLQLPRFQTSVCTALIFLSHPSPSPEICVCVDSRYFRCDIPPCHPCPGCNYSADTFYFQCYHIPVSADLYKNSPGFLHFSVINQ